MNDEWIIVTWFSNNSDSRCALVSEWSAHCQSWDVFFLQPYSQRPDWVSIMISKRIDPPSALDDSFSFICLARFLVPANSLGNNFARFWSSFDNDAPRIADICAEKLLSKRDQADTCWPWEADIHVSIEKGLVAIKERIIESNAYFIGVEHLYFLFLLHLLLILLQDKPEFSLEKHRQLILQIGWHFSTPLAMAIANWEEVTVLDAAKVRNRDPIVLILFVRIWWSEASLGGKGELCHTVSWHLFGICIGKRVLAARRSNFCLQCICRMDALVLASNSIWRRLCLKCLCQTYDGRSFGFSSCRNNTLRDRLHLHWKCWSSLVSLHEDVIDPDWLGDLFRVRLGSFMRLFRGDSLLLLSLFLWFLNAILLIAGRSFVLSLLLLDLIDLNSICYSLLSVIGLYNLLDIVSARHISLLLHHLLWFLRIVLHLPGYNRHDVLIAISKRTVACLLVLWVKQVLHECLLGGRAFLLNECLFLLRLGWIHLWYISLSILTFFPLDCCTWRPLKTTSFDAELLLLLLPANSGRMAPNLHRGHSIVLLLNLLQEGVCWSVCCRIVRSEIGWIFAAFRILIEVAHRANCVGLVLWEGSPLSIGNNRPYLDKIVLIAHRQLLFLGYSHNDTIVSYF